MRVPVSDTDADEEALYYVHYQDCECLIAGSMPCTLVLPFASLIRACTVTNACWGSALPTSVLSR